MNSSRTRTLVAAAAAGALGVTLMAACGGSTSSGSSDSESGEAFTGSLRVVDYYTDEPDKTIYQNMLDTCAASVGVTVEREVIPGADLVQKVLQMSSSKTLPDILMLDNPDLAQIAATGALMPLDEVGLSAEGEAQGVVDAATYDGKVYGLQPIANTIALYYRPDVLAAAGVEVPTTWDELTAAAAKLTSGSQYGIAFAAPANYEGTWQFLPFMWSNGADEKNLDTPEMAAAVKLWADLVADGSASESVVNWTQADVNDQFKAGNAAMMINGPWQNPVLDEAGTDYAVAQIPAPTAGGTVQAPLGGEVWTIPVNSDQAKQTAAAKVVECLNTDDNEMSLATQRQTVPTRLSLQDTFVQENPQMAAYSEMITTARARTGELGAEWPATATQIYQILQLAIVGDATPEDAITQVVGN